MKRPRFGLQARLRDGLLQRNLRVCGRIAHEAQLFAVDQLFHIDLRNASDLAAQAQFFEHRHVLNPGAAFAQRSLHGFQTHTNTGDDSGPCNYHPTLHAAFSLPSPSRRNKPTRRSLAT